MSNNSCIPSESYLCLPIMSIHTQVLRLSINATLRERVLGSQKGDADVDS